MQKASASLFYKASSFLGPYKKQIIIAAVALVFTAGLTLLLVQYARITTDTTLIQSVLGSSASIALRNFLMLIGGTIFLFITNPKLTSVVMICIPLVVGPILFLGRKVRRLSRNSQDKIANVGAYVGESIQQIKTVQAYNHQSHDDQQFSAHVETAFSVALRRIMMRSFLITIVMTLVFSALAIMIWVGAGCYKWRYVGWGVDCLCRLCGASCCNCRGDQSGC